jgi:hypothetical protein
VDEEEPAVGTAVAAVLVCCARVKPVKATRSVMVEVKYCILSSASIVD